MELISIADRFTKNITDLSPVDKKWIFGNETDDPLRYAFDAKKVVHPIVKGIPLPKDEWSGLWNKLTVQQGRKTKRSAYIHIPFCQTRCLYCGFFQNFSDSGKEDIYIDHLIRELKTSADSRFIRTLPIHAVYLGGGTPSALSVKNIKRLLSAIKLCLPLANDCEITFESRFHDFTDEKIQACLYGGVNRFSLGVQSFNTKVRTSIGRLDSRETILERLNYLMSLGSAVVVIDLMYGLPHQTMDIWRDDVMTLADCAIDGGDLYQLNVYEDSRLKAAIEKGNLPPAAKTSEQALMFKEGVEIMEKKRFRRLSVCHWGNGTRERNMYNSYTMSGTVTIPFGAGAGGQIEGYAFFLDRDMKRYIERIDNGEKPIAAMIAPLDNHELFNSISGQMNGGQLNLKWLKTVYGVDLENIMDPIFKEWERKGLIEINGDCLDLTTAGQFWYVNLTQAVLDWLVKMSSEDYATEVRAIAGQG